MSQDVSRDRVQVYRDNAGEWRWRVKAANGQVAGTSGEGFTRKWSAKRAARRWHPNLPIEVVK